MPRCSSRYLVTGRMAATAALSAATVADLVPGGDNRFAAFTAGLALTTGLAALVAGLLRLGFLASVAAIIARRRARDASNRSSPPVAAAFHGCGSGAASHRTPPGACSSSLASVSRLTNETLARVGERKPRLACWRAAPRGQRGACWPRPRSWTLQ